MKFDSLKKVGAYLKLGVNIIPNRLLNRLVSKITILLILLALIVTLVLLGVTNSKINSLNHDKEIMADSLSKISSALSKKSPREVSTSLFMDSSRFSEHTAFILKQIKELINKREVMMVALQSIANTVRYSYQDLYEVNDIGTLQRKLRSLIEDTKKLFILNEKLTLFVLETAKLISQNKIDQNEFQERLMISPESICFPLFEEIEKEKSYVDTLQQEIDTKASTIIALKKKRVESDEKRDELYRIIQKKEDELTKLRCDCLDLRAQIENIKKQSASKENKSSQEELVKKSLHTEPYYELRGSVIKYNEKWGFVIINIGSNNKFKSTINGDLREVNVPIPLDKEIYIKRGDKLVAKANIISVYKDYSVANVCVPSSKGVRSGDDVFFNQAKNN